jgi:polar amino acid transport system permease protein
LFSKGLSIFVKFALMVGLIYFLFFATYQKLHWSLVWDYRSLFFKGWWITIGLSSASLILSLLIGLIAAFASQYKSSSTYYWGYVELIRGTPLLVQILFFFYVVAHLIGLSNRYLAAILILSFFHGAYIAEMMRSAIESVSKTQLESAKAIGLTNLQSYRFVIFPQTIRQIIPPLAGQFASIIKDSSLLSIIGINELTNSAQQINSATYSTLETYLPLGVAYLLLTLPISMWSKRLEKKFHYET